jgi:hypothetical protein
VSIRLPSAWCPSDRWGWDAAYPAASTDFDAQLDATSAVARRTKRLVIKFRRHAIKIEKIENLFVVVEEMIMMTVTLHRFCSGTAVPITLAGTARQCGQSAACCI